MNSGWHDDSTVRVFIPRSCRADSLRKWLLRACGGYTEHHDTGGHWLDATGVDVAEPVRVLEGAAFVAHYALEQAITHEAYRFMHDNPGEQCFMAQLRGPQVHRTFLLYRKDVP